MRIVRKKNIEEEATTSGGGEIAGLGVGAQGEPGVNPLNKYRKKNKEQAPVMGEIQRRLEQPIFEVKKGKFAGHDTYEVPEKVFHAARLAKKKGAHWTKYLQETDYGRAISKIAKNSKAPIILQCEKTGYMCYARYGK